MLEEIEKGEKILQWLEEWSLWVYEASKKHILNIIDCYGITWACTHPNGWWITRNTKQISKKFHFISYNVNSCEEGSSHYFLVAAVHSLQCASNQGVSPKVSKGAGISFQLKIFLNNMGLCVTFCAMLHFLLVEFTNFFCEQYDTLKKIPLAIMRWV